MVTATDRYLGVGLYTTAEAATYARIPTAMMSRWLYGNRRGDRVLSPRFADDDEKRVTFLDFVQALAVRNIRVQHKIPLGKIRKAVEQATQNYNLPYPFATEHTTYLFQNEVFIFPPGEEDPVQITGKHTHQRAWKKIIELYMEDLTFDQSGIANLYRAYMWHTREVLMDPKRRFGEPIVASCGYTAQVLWEACKAEGSVKAAAQAYGITTDEVEIGFRYFDSLLHG